MSATTGKDCLAIAFLTAVGLSLGVPIAWADAGTKVHSSTRGPVAQKTLSGAGKISQVKLQSQQATADLPPVAPDRRAGDLRLPERAAGRDLSPGVAPALSAASSGSTRQLLQRGATQFAQGNAEEAESSFRQVLINDRNNTDALFNLGSLSERRGDLESALSFYRRALNLKKNDAELQQAVTSIQNQIQTERSSSEHKAALHGSAVANDLYSMQNSMPPTAPQLVKTHTPLLGTVQSNNMSRIQLGSPQQAQFGQQPFSVPVYGNRVPQSSVSQLPVPVLSVHQPPIRPANVTQPQEWKQAIPLVHVGMGLVPGMRGMSCPVCGLLNKF